MGRIRPIRWTLKNGEQVKLSTCTPRDASASVAYLRVFFEHAPFVATSPGEFNRTPAQQRSFFAERARHPGKLMIKATIGGRIVAMAGFECGPKRKLAHQGELGMGVAHDLRGAGIGRRLLTAILDWAHASPTIEKVDLGVYPQNTAAVALYRSAGFVVECRHRCAFKHVDGSRHDGWTMAVYVKPGIAPRGFKAWPPARMAAKRASARPSTLRS
ncbi:MAG: GNAT family N-acetyltransferase [Phycisphaerales bacterium]